VSVSGACTCARINTNVHQATYALIGCVAVGMLVYTIFRKQMQLWFSLEDEFIKRKLEDQAIKDAEWNKAGLNMDAV
jgi:hypothetical protein